MSDDRTVTMLAPKRRLQFLVDCTARNRSEQEAREKASEAGIRLDERLKVTGHGEKPVEAFERLVEQFESS